MVHTFNPSSQEAETGQSQQVSLQVQGDPGLHSEFQGSQRYTVKPYLKKRKEPGSGAACL